MKIDRIPRFLLLIASVMIMLVLFFPFWRIELDAPQYPEGLKLEIWAHKLAGDVDIINGLNHYIGMKTMHTKDFFEFAILPYLIIGFSLLGLLCFAFNKRKLLFAFFILFLTFGIVALIDFYRWEYNYGHNLDPTAPIQVPGMAYQPPLLGFKQLLNFGAYSIPDIGGFLFMGAGFLLLCAVFLQFKKKKATS